MRRIAITTAAIATAAITASVLGTGCTSSSTSLGGSSPSAASDSVVSSLDPSVTGSLTPLVSAPDTSDTSEVDTATPATNEPAFGGGDVDLPDPSAGLTSLSSYTATLTVTFDGTSGGAPLQVRRTETMVNGVDPLVRVLTIDAPASGVVADVHARVGDFIFVREQGGSCTAGSALVDVDSAVAEPALSLSGFIGATSIGDETLDGIDVHHVSFDGAALGLQDTNTVEGQAWIAIDGGYVIRYSVVSTGPAAFLGADTDGTVTIDYVLSAIGAPVVAGLPPDCPPIVDAVLVDDATDIEAVPGSVSYHSAKAAADVLAFHRASLSSADWSPTDSVQIADAAGGRLQFHRGAEQLTVVVASEDGITTVVLLASMQGL